MAKNFNKKSISTTTIPSINKNDKIIEPNQTYNDKTEDFAAIYQSNSAHKGVSKKIKYIIFKKLVDTIFLSYFLLS